MSKVRLDYIHKWRDEKTGRFYFYFRKRGMRRVRLPGPFGSTAFMEAYGRALEGKIEPGAALRSKPGSVSAAIAAYYDSTAWAGGLSDGTKAMRRAILERFRERYGELPLGKLPQAFLEKYLDTLKPHAARNHLKALRGWLQHAKHDVTQGLKPPKVKSERHHSWTAEEIAQYEAHHPIGSKARLCFALAKYTGQRRSDIALMARQHIADGVLYVKQKKTGVQVWVPVHPELQAIIDKTPGPSLMFLTTQSGRPYAPTDLSEQFRAWCDQAGLPQRCVMHGMRHATGALLADLNCSPHQISAILGCSVKMALHYSQGADRKRAAREAMGAWVASTNREPQVSKHQPGLTFEGANLLKLKAKK